MKKDWLRIIGMTLLFLFLGLYTASRNGYIDYQARNQMILTQEQIEKFEEDVKNQKPIDIENYIVREEELYDNQLSRVSLKISNTIGHTVENVLNFIFGKLEGMMNPKA
ncbi:MAG: hypothetical protein HFG40_04310 [Bacilli bacterium]|nr:hypothetical protein [Bacilli bacterium]